MSFHHRTNQQAVFGNTITSNTGGTALAGTPTTTAAGSNGAGLNTSSTNTVNPNQQGQIQTSGDPVVGQYQAIFAQQMEQQAKLYGDITKLNDFKNQQSSYLSLAKGVSEMV